MKFLFYEVSMASLHVLTCGMGMGDESKNVWSNTFYIWVPWAQAYNLQSLKIIKAINQSINNTVHQYNININQQIQPEVSMDIIIKHNINHISTW